jgi:pyruvate/2-oxoglutarate dehydrogenase complex dihydrolipoamide acyltransferase (E2) component
MGMQDGEIVNWLKSEGDLVVAGEPMVEVETAKVNDTVNAPVAGRLMGVLATVGEIVEVGAVLAEIESEP